MKADEIRFLYGYDRWATQRVLGALDGINEEVWGRTHVVDERGLGSILAHQLGAAQRWRMSFQTEGDAVDLPQLEKQPLPSIDELRAMWEEEWAATDEWLASISDGFVNYAFEGVPVWHMLVHVVNHGTQHRSEAAALMNAEGHSPGELDLVDYSDEVVARSKA